MSNYLERKTPLSCPHLLRSALGPVRRRRAVCPSRLPRLLHPVKGTRCRRAPGSAPHEQRRLNSEPKAEVHGKQMGMIKFIA